MRWGSSNGGGEEGEKNENKCKWRRRWSHVLAWLSSVWSETRYTCAACLVCTKRLGVSSVRE